MGALRSLISLNILLWVMLYFSDVLPDTSHTAIVLPDISTIGQAFIFHIQPHIWCARWTHREGLAKGYAKSAKVGPARAKIYEKFLG